MATKGMSEFRNNGEDFTINDPNVADEFSTSSAYEAGDHVYYQGNLYEFTAAHSAGAWNSGHVTRVLVGNEVKTLKYDQAVTRKDVDGIQFKTNTNAGKTVRAISYNATQGGTISYSTTNIYVGAKIGQTFTLEVIDENNVFTDESIPLYATWDENGTFARYDNPNSIFRNTKQVITDGSRAIDYIGIYKQGMNAGEIGFKVTLDENYTEHDEKEYAAFTFTQGTAAGKSIQLKHSIKNGAQFRVTLHAANGILNKYVPIYFKNSTEPEYVRNGSIETNIPRIYTADRTIDAVQIYTTPLLSGRGSIEVEIIGDDHQYLAEGAADIRLELPYYYTRTYLWNKMARIQELIEACSGNGDLFIFITDEHFDNSEMKSPAIINFLDKHMNIPRLFSGGDMHEDGPSYEMVELLKKAFHGKQYYVVGNHEYLPKGEKENDDNTIGYAYYMYNDEIVGNPERHYYFVNNNQQKIRYIILNAFKEVDSQGIAQNGYTEDQIAWLRDVALDVETGWTILIFTHLLYQIGMSTDVLSIWDTNIRDVIEGYNGNGTIAAVFQGHTHRDRYHIMSNGVPVIITTCDKNRVWTYDGSPDINVDRSSGTTNEQAFDVVVLNKTLRQINCVRIGGNARDGEDNNVGTEVNERVFNY